MPETWKPSQPQRANEVINHSEESTNPSLVAQHHSKLYSKQLSFYLQINVTLIPHQISSLYNWGRPLPKLQVVKMQRTTNSGLFSCKWYIYNTAPTLKPQGTWQKKRGQKNPKSSKTRKWVVGLYPRNDGKLHPQYHNRWLLQQDPNTDHNSEHDSVKGLPLQGSDSYRKNYRQLSTAERGGIRLSLNWAPELVI